MGKVLKFTDEQKFAVALDLIAGKLSHAEVCRKYDISATYAYKLKDRALEKEASFFRQCHIDWMLIVGMTLALPPRLLR